MANPRPIATYPSPAEYLELDRSNNLALPVEAQEAPGADQIPGATVQVAVDEGYDPPDTYDDYGDWKEDYADAVGISSWKTL